MRAALLMRNDGDQPAKTVSRQFHFETLWASTVRMVLSLIDCVAIGPPEIQYQEVASGLATTRPERRETGEPGTEGVGPLLPADCHNLACV